MISQHLLSSLVYTREWGMSLGRRKRSILLLSVLGLSPRVQPGQANTGMQSWGIFSAHFAEPPLLLQGEPRGSLGMRHSAEITTCSHSEHTNMQNRLGRVWCCTGRTKSWHCWQTFEQMARFHAAESMANLPREAGSGCKCAVNSPGL